MHGDFSRRTHDPRKHYSAVLQEQGRLLSDADLEEEHRILSSQLETTAADLIGGCGGPIGAAGFEITSPDGQSLLLNAGRYYVGGMLITNEAQVSYVDQPDRVAADIAWPPPPGRYAIVLDVWRRLITALDDPSIREVALGGPTTSAREKTVWQARHISVDRTWTCSDPLPEQAATTGTMAARAEPEAALPTPCLVPPLAGYVGLENQLYRVEVFATGAALDLASAPVLPITSFPPGSTNQVVVSSPDATSLNVGEVVEVISTGPGSDPLESTFAQVAGKAGTTISLTSRLPVFASGSAPALRRAPASVVISRENGSVVTGIDRVDGTEVTVRDLGPDSVLGFAPGQWVELTDDRGELERRPRQLRQIESIDTDRLVVTLRTAATALAATPDGVESALHPKLRRWDAARGVVLRSDGTGWIHLENGIQVRFDDGEYLSGDSWRFPARAAIVDAASGNIEWPQQAGAPALLPPAGVAHHFCTIGIVDVTQSASGTSDVAIVDDCRNLFPPVTELTTLLYVGGDGQEATLAAGGAFAPLPAPLTVRAANGSFPVQGAQVQFQITQGSGRLNGAAGPVTVTTDADGLAACAWELDTNTDAQQCEAHLLTRGGAAIPHQIVRFQATLDRDQGGRRGCCYSIGPDGDFETVEKGVDELLSRGERDLCFCLLAGDHVIGELLLKPRDPGVKFHFSLRGCGHGARVRVKGNIFADHWASVRLLDFDLLFEPDRTLHTLGVSEVTLEGMRVRGMPPRVGLVRIHAASRVHVGKCVLEARTAGDFGRLKAIFAGVGPLEGIWDAADEADHPAIFRRTADEIDGFDAANRRAITEALDRRVADQSLGLGVGLADRLRLLSAVIGTKRDPAAVAEAIAGVKAAVAKQSNLVALEIGAPDDLQEKIADPSSVTPTTITIVDNEMAGDISFYGVAGGRLLSPNERPPLESRLKENGINIGLAGTVHLRDNRFGRVLLSAGMFEAIRQLATGQGARLRTLFESFHMTNNVVDSLNGQLAALHVVLTSNDFTFAAVPTPTGLPVVALEVVADTAVYTGNHGAVFTVPGAGAQPAVVEQTVRASAVAAQLELQIQ